MSSQPFSLKYFRLWKQKKKKKKEEEEEEEEEEKINDKGKYNIIDVWVYKRNMLSVWECGKPGTGIIRRYA